MRALSRSSKRLRWQINIVFFLCIIVLVTLKKRKEDGMAWKLAYALFWMMVACLAILAILTPFDEIIVFVLLTILVLKELFLSKR